MEYISKTLLTILLLASSLSASPVSENGKLRVQGLQLVNACGLPVQLKGVSSHGLQWFGLNGSDTVCLKAGAMDFIADETTGMSADVFRAAMYVDSGGYLSDPTRFINEVNTLVDMAQARGMYVIIDWHILNPGDPNISISAASTFWNTMSTTHAGKDHVLYEIANEPNGVSWATVKNYHDTIIPIIRANDSDTIIIAGTPNWSQLGAAVVASPLAYTNIMYTFHFYAASHTTSMLTTYIADLPIFITEWGTCAASGGAPFDYVNAQAFLDIAAGANAAGVTLSWANWSFADKNEAASELLPGSCTANSWNVASLTTSGNFIRDNINGTLGSANNNWSACVGTPTNTRTNTPVYSPTATMTFTASPTPTETPVYASVPFCEDFELGGLGVNWKSNSTGTGRIQVNGSNAPYAGVNHVLMDSDTNGSNGLNEIILHINLAGVINPQLDFYVKEFGDELHSMPATFVGSQNYDGVAISENGVSWTRITTLNPTLAYTLESFSLGPIMASGGFTDFTKIRIKFQQYDNYAIPTDGFAFDDICVTGTPPTPTYTSTPTYTPTPTFTRTHTPLPTLTDTPSPTVTFTPTVTDTFTQTFTPTVSETFTPVPVGSTYTNTPTNTTTYTLTATPVDTATSTPTPTFTPVNTDTFTQTLTFTPTFTYTHTPLNTATPFISATTSPTPTPAIDDGPNRIIRAIAAPNPNPQVLSLELAGPVDSIEIEFFTTGMTKIGSITDHTRRSAGWVNVDIQPAIAGLSNGLFYFRAVPVRDGEKGESGNPGRCLIMK